MADDLFSQIDDEVVTSDEVKFEDLVGEGKRYRDQDAVTKALLTKDAFIEQLKRENAEARKTIQERINMEQFLEKLQKAPPSPSELDTTPTERDVTPAAVTPETIEQIIEAREAKKKAEDNLATVVKRLKETFGVEYKRHLQEKAVALNTSTQWLTDVAARNPEAFYELVGVNKQQSQETFSPPPRGSVSAPVSGAKKKDFAYFQALKKEKGDDWYFSPSTRQEIWRELQAQGEDAFYGRRP